MQLAYCYITNKSLNRNKFITGVLMLDNILLFIKLYETRSFKKCAELLNTSPSTISKHIADLEYKLGKQLIVRTPKTFEPTPYGKYIYNNLRNIPAFTESVINSYHTKRKNNNVGTLNVAIGTSVSYELISPYIDEFLELNPNVKLNIKFMTQISKWPSEDTSITLGMTEINQPTLDSKFIRTEKAKLYCSKEYALKYGLPEKPDQLVNHRIIGIIGVLHEEILDDHILIHNLKNNSSFILDLSNIKLRTNNLLHNKKIGMSSNYIFGSNDSLVSRDLQNGTIIPVLPDWYTLEVSFYLTTKKTINKLERSFVEFIYERMNKSYDLVMTNLMDISNQVE